MKYLSGEEVHVGDNVLIENRHTAGVVEHIIESRRDLREWNVNEKGVLLASAPFGSLFWPIEKRDDPVKFVSRANT